MDARRRRPRPASAAAAQVHLVAGNERGLTRAGSRLSALGSRLMALGSEVCFPIASLRIPISTRRNVAIGHVRKPKAESRKPKAESPEPRAGPATSMRAVVLLSGGLDSYTAAAMAQRDGFELYALTVNYGQRHLRELESARRVARALAVVRHLELTVDLRAVGGSSLTSAEPVPRDRDLNVADI